MSGYHSGKVDPATWSHQIHAFFLHSTTLASSTRCRTASPASPSGRPVMVDPSWCSRSGRGGRSRRRAINEMLSGPRVGGCLWVTVLHSVLKDRCSIGGGRVVNTQQGGVVNIHLLMPGLGGPTTCQTPLVLGSRGHASSAGQHRSREGT